MTHLIYKIETHSAWMQAQTAGRYQGSELDAADGYIHMSSQELVRDTAAKYFAGRADLVLIRINSDALGEALVWEASRGGALFPHLYSDLPLDAVVDVAPLLLDADGQFVFGPEIP